MAYIEKRPPSRKFPRGGHKARYRDRDGTIHSKTLATKTEAQAWLDVNGADLVRGEWLDPTLRRRLFDEWADKWLEGTHVYAPTTRSSTWRLFKKHIEPEYIGWEIGAIDRAEVKAFIRRKQRAGYSPKYVREMVWILAQVLEEAVEGGALKVNPARNHRLPRKKKKIGTGDVFDMDQVLRLVDELPEWARPVVWLLVLAGLRPSEACGSA